MFSPYSCSKARDCLILLYWSFNSSIEDLRCSFSLVKLESAKLKLESEVSCSSFIYNFSELRFSILYSKDLILSFEVCKSHKVCSWVDSNWLNWSVKLWNSLFFFSRSISSLKITSCFHSISESQSLMEAFNSSIVFVKPFFSLYSCSNWAWRISTLLIS